MDSTRTGTATSSSIATTPTSRPSFDNYSCVAYPSAWCPCPEDDPDIAGIGVVIAFILTTGLTAILSFSLLILTIPTIPRHRVDRDINKIIRGTRRLITSSNVFSRLRQLFHTRAKSGEQESQSSSIAKPTEISRREIWINVLRKSLLAFSDQSLILGIAMLLIQLLALRPSSLKVSGYEFAILGELAWLSSLTQMQALVSLGPLIGSKTFEIGYQETVDDIETQTRTSIRELAKTLVSKNERSNAQHTSLPVLRISRAIALLTMFLLLIISSTVGPSTGWNDDMTCPAPCLARYYLGSGLLENIAWIILLFPNYIPPLWDLLNGNMEWLLVLELSGWKARAFLSRLAIRVVERVASVFIKKKSALDRDVKGFFYASMVMIWLITAFWSFYFDQQLFILFWFLSSSEYVGPLTFLLFYAAEVRTIIEYRRLSMVPFDVCTKQSSLGRWGSGQIIPLVLMVLPLLTAIQIYSDEKLQRKLSEAEEVEMQGIAQNSEEFSMAGAVEPTATSEGAELGETEHVNEPGNLESIDHDGSSSMHNAGEHEAGHQGNHSSTDGIRDQNAEHEASSSGITLQQSGNVSQRQHTW